MVGTSGAPSIFALVVATFWPAREFAFLRFDDPIYVTENPLVRDGLSWSSLTGSFRPRDGNFIPLTWLSLAADAELLGLPDAPACAWPMMNPTTATTITPMPIAMASER